MRILELFAGTGSIGKEAIKKGHEVYSVDISDKYYTPDYLGDILLWNYEEFSPGHFDLIWASPPCCKFSSMNFLRKTKEQIIADEINIGLPPLNKTLEIINYFKPKYYAIENPQTSRIKHYIPHSMPCKTVSYCRYGFLNRKNTNIWTNIDFEPRYCKPSDGCPHSKKHLKTIGTTRNNTIEKIRLIESNKKYRFMIPELLCKDILEACI